LKQSKPFNPLEQLEEARFKRVADKMKTQKDKIQDMYVKNYTKIEQIPEDWSLKTKVNISFPSSKFDHL
jgi:hypothetical protein